MLSWVLQVRGRHGTGRPMKLRAGPGSDGIIAGIELAARQHQVVIVDAGRRRLTAPACRAPVAEALSCDRLPLVHRRAAFCRPPCRPMQG